MVDTRYPKTRILMFVLLVASAVVILTEIVALSYGYVDWYICYSQNRFSVTLETTRFGTSVTARVLDELLKWESLFFVGLKLPFLLTILVSARKWTAISAFVFLALPLILLIAPKFFDGNWHDCDHKGCTICTGVLFFQYMLFLPIGGIQLVYALITRVFFDRI